MPRWVVVRALLLPVAGAALSLVASVTSSQVTLSQLTSSQAWAQAPGVVPDDPMEGLRLGESIRAHREEVSEYRCDPSVEFAQLTFCNKIRFERDRHGSSNVMYSFMHTREGVLVYVDRYQRPAVLDSTEAAQRIDRISRRRNDTARTHAMPQRPGLPDGMLAVWGETVLDPLTDARVAAIAKGQVEGTEFLIDFLGNVTRSARERLPIWRFAGGAGFVWVAALDPRGYGFLRMTAVDASAIAKAK
jgi:hypothetical protein